ncbi:carbohydrate ABC transporter permease [Xaviernesmea oryzae]|uniref:carbohydrate ABC transporter permease n=1 Tax=Xaviernesmea oryzae TaxID=464029 RepID=UPI0009F94668|nr:sugar ABC transporter permease [Xaviernesmea oryzae]
MARIAQTISRSDSKATAETPDITERTAAGGETTRRRRPSPYPHWFLLPAAIIYTVLFLVPTATSFWYSMTRWDLKTATFIGFENFHQFFSEPFLVQGLVNTLIYAALTSAMKTVCGLGLAVLLTSDIVARGLLRAIVFFPVLVSTIGVGIAFTVMMHPTRGVFNVALASVGVAGPGWLTDPALALFSVALVDLWKGVGLATLIFIAGLSAISPDYYEAARIDGATRLQQFRRITLPLVRPATVTVVTLSLIGGLRSFDLIWAMTRGGPGFASDVIASVIYKQYQAGFYGLSTAGNVILFLLISVIILPLTVWFQRREVEQ